MDRPTFVVTSLGAMPLLCPFKARIANSSRYQGRTPLLVSKSAMAAVGPVPSVDWLTAALRLTRAVGHGSPKPNHTYYARRRAPVEF
jgi:hypothetical protein